MGGQQQAPPLAADVGSSLRDTVEAVGTGWRATGSFGRIGLVGVVLAAFVVVALGFEIRDSVRREAVQVRTDVLQALVDEVTEEIVDPDGFTASAATIVQTVDAQLGGGEVVGVVVRDADGDVVERVGVQPGEPSQRRMPSATLHGEQHADGLLHFDLPVTDDAGRRVGSVAVLQESESFEAMLDRITVYVFVVIVVGLGLLGLALGGMVAANARVITRARDDARRLSHALLRAEEDERRRTIGSLHDDVGQPLYRLLYGLQGCRSRVASTSPLASELDRLVALVRQVDATLHDELQHLHRGVLDDLDLRSALDDLVATSCGAAGLAHELAVDVSEEPGRDTRSVLLRTAQEAITNIRKHAGARHVAVRVVDTGDAWVLEVVDDGVGFEGRLGLGLTTTRERLDAVGGGLRVKARPSGGTRLVAWMPRGEVAS